VCVLIHAFACRKFGHDVPLGELPIKSDLLTKGERWFCQREPEPLIRDYAVCTVLAR
jgi:hypothetical protein